MLVASLGPERDGREIEIVWGGMGGTGVGWGCIWMRTGENGVVEVVRGGVKLGWDRLGWGRLGEGVGVGRGMVKVWWGWEGGRVGIGWVGFQVGGWVGDRKA